MSAKREMWERIGWSIACAIYAIYMVGCVVAFYFYAWR